MKFLFTHALQTHHAGYGNHGAVIGTQALRREEDVSAALAAGFNKAGSERLIGGHAACHHQLFDAGRFDGFDGLGGEHFGNRFSKRQSQIRTELGIRGILGIVDGGQNSRFEPREAHVKRRRVQHRTRQFNGPGRSRFCQARNGRTARIAFA